MKDKTWFFMLLKDEEFVDNIIKRYGQLREDILSDEEIVRYIQSARDYLGCAVDRNFKVWGYTFDPKNDRMMDADRKIDSYDMAVEKYQSWLLERLDWIDENIDTLRSYSHESVNKKFNH